MKVSDYIAERFAHLGVDTAFMVTGGGAMHLNDSIANHPNIRTIFNHHEQASAMAAEGYARIAKKPAIVSSTTGPGALNTINGVFGAFTDSIPMIIVAGQVKRATISTFVEPTSSLRQLGDQEVKSIDVVSPITKYSVIITESQQIVEEVDKCFSLATNGRPGPVWLEVPVDVQALEVEADPTAHLRWKEGFQKTADETEFASILAAIRSATRPVILAGSGVSISGTESQLLEVAELSQIPVVTAWSHDIFDNSNALFAGRAGTIGTRPGNFVVQSADLVIVLGSRLNIRQVSYNWSSFAPLAKIIWVDVDSSELKKPFPRADIRVNADLKTFLPELVERLRLTSGKFDRGVWLRWVSKINEKYSPKPSDYPTRRGGINPYHFVMELFEKLDENHVVACGNATACIVPFQVGKLTGSMKMFSNSGSASMGFDLPAALGAAVADPSRPVIALAGDGSLMMNLQELATLAALDLNVGLIVLDNGGYLSIRQTQTNFFGRETGASPNSGVVFPDFEKVAKAFGLDATTIKIDGPWVHEVDAFVKATGPRVLVVKLDHDQEFEPRLKSKMVNGVIQTPPLDDMHPSLPDQELLDVRSSALALEDELA